MGSATGAHQAQHLDTPTSSTVLPELSCQSHGGCQSRALLGLALTGPWVPSQIENEFGFVGPDLPYLKELLRIAREILGDDVIIYTTDPPPRLANGTIPGPDVYT